MNIGNSRAFDFCMDIMETAQCQMCRCIAPVCHDVDPTTEGECVLTPIDYQHLLMVCTGRQLGCFSKNRPTVRQMINILLFVIVIYVYSEASLPKDSPHGSTLLRSLGGQYPHSGAGVAGDQIEIVIDIAVGKIHEMFRLACRSNCGSILSEHRNTIPNRCDFIIGSEARERRRDTWGVRDKPIFRESHSVRSVLICHKDRAKCPVRRGSQYLVWNLNGLAV